MVRVRVMVRVEERRYALALTKFLLAYLLPYSPTYLFAHSRTYLRTSTSTYLQSKVAFALELVERDVARVPPARAYLG